jgi:hypothetical protein
VKIPRIIFEVFNLNLLLLNSIVFTSSLQPSELNNVFNCVKKHTHIPFLLIFSLEKYGVALYSGLYGKLRFYRALWCRDMNIHVVASTCTFRCQKFTSNKTGKTPVGRRLFRNLRKFSEAVSIILMTGQEAGKRTHQSVVPTEMFITWQRTYFMSRYNDSLSILSRKTFHGIIKLLFLILLIIKH